MDYTLAQYNDNFALLAYDGAKEKLCNVLGFPQDVMNFEYSSTLFRRGLVIDKKNGNIVKTDRHRYARIAHHGLTELSSEKRKKVYNKLFTSFTGSNYVMIDTLFLLIDALLFAQLVDLKDKSTDNEFLAGKSYEDLYKDVRTCVDMCHRDGVIKDAVMNDPSKYIIEDPDLVPMLKRYRVNKKKVFLLTNSFWDYTNIVMNYLITGKSSIDENENKKWTEEFDVVIVGACKPAFLKDSYLSMFRINEESGVLENIEDKDTFFDDDNGGGKIFQGGNWNDLHALLNLPSQGGGEKILYVGDHMYSDVLRSKRTLGWRTCLIIPELDHELNIYGVETALIKELRYLRQVQYDLDEYLDLLRQKDKMSDKWANQLSQAEIKAGEIKLLISQKRKELSKKFNDMWGQLFKAGHQDSAFALQVCDFACIYTSKASNLGNVNPNRPFRPYADYMPHDQSISDEEKEIILDPVES